MNVKFKGKKVKWFFAILGAGLVTAGAIATPFVVANQSTQIIKKTNISKQQTENFKEQSQKMVASKEFYYESQILNKSTEEANQKAYDAVGTYNHKLHDELNNFERAKSVNQQLKAYSDEETEYAVLTKLNRQYDIDPTDIQRAKEVYIPQMEKVVQDNAGLPGYDKKDVEDRLNALNTTGLMMIQNYQLDAFESGKLVNAAVEQDPQKVKAANLRLGCAYLEDALSNKIHIISDDNKVIKNNMNADSTAFIPKLAVYSSTGKTGYKDGDVIRPDDMEDLFTYDYDLTNGVLLSQAYVPNIDYQTADVVPPESGDL
jgi:hypothetical protein